MIKNHVFYYWSFQAPMASGENDFFFENMQTKKI